MKRDKTLELEQLAGKESKLDNLVYQRDSLQRDLDLVQMQIDSLQADIDILTVKYADTIQAKAAEILAEREILVEKV